MKERPILFSAPMVRAILAGRKTQTRRVLKQATGLSLSVNMDDNAPGDAELSWLHGDGPGHEVHEHIERVRCPYGAPGDRLWVRENWKVISDGGTPDAENDTDCTIEYVADGATQTFATGKRLYPARDRVSPSIHLPRWACRLVLEVVGVGVERLQQLSRADAAAEGICFPDAEPKPPGYRCDRWPEENFAALWDSINGAGAWAANPWVWVVEFRRVP